MSFTIRNITAGPAVAVPLGDIGITLAASGDRDLLERLSLNCIYMSADLLAAVNDDKIIILNGGVPLSKAASLVALSGELVLIGGGDGGGSPMATREFSGTTDTLVLADSGKRVISTGASDNVVTIPAYAAVAFEVGALIHLIDEGAGISKILADTDVSINGVLEGSGYIIGQYKIVYLLNRGVDDWIVYNEIGLINTNGFNKYTHTYAGNTSILNNQITFDGAGDYVGVDSPTAIESVFKGTGDFTMEIDIHADTNAIDIFFGIGYGDGGWSMAGDNMLLFVQTATNIQFVWNNAFSQTTLEAAGSIQSGITRLTAVRESSRISLYVGASRIATTTTDTEIQDMSGAGTLAVLFGQATDLGANIFDGQIDKVRISDTARYTATDSSITNLALTHDVNAIYLNTFTGDDGSTPVKNTEW